MLRHSKIRLMHVVAVGALFSVAALPAGCGGSYGEPPPVAKPGDSAEGSNDQSARSKGAGQGESAKEKAIVLKPSAAPDNLKPQWDPEGIADFEFVERSGRKVGKAELLGRPWAVCFVFTRCAGPCLGITSQMAQLQAWLEDDDVRLVTITVDPKHDTPDVLRGYADHFGADEEKWLFLTGDQDEIYGLIRDSFRLPVREVTGPERKPGWEIFHSAMILHVDAAGRVAGQYDGRDPVQVAALRRALEREVNGK